MKQQFVSMLTLQDKMNSKVNADWVAQNFAWYRALWIECGELIEHHGYKWWKKQEPDMEQVKLEIIDIWHFGMSMLFDGRPIDEIAEDMQQQLLEREVSTCSVLEATEALAADVLSHRVFSVAKFWDLLRAADMTDEELYQHYIGKNVLNFFRQDNGYKDGSYVKCWDGKEDNEYLSGILEQKAPESEDYATWVYQQLQLRYQQLS
jgi:dimeric dUTPase (all-alpha-NTP-PPase superfamily)